MDDSSLFEIILWDLCIFGLLFVINFVQRWIMFGKYFSSHNEKYRLKKSVKCRSVRGKSIGYCERDYYHVRYLIFWKIMDRITQGLKKKINSLLVVITLYFVLSLVCSMNKYKYKIFMYFSRWIFLALSSTIRFIFISVSFHLM